MDYTREPIIESVITAREGCKLVIRSSKGMSQEEYFIDAVELITFGSALFYRSLEKPKAFLLPVQDYEVVEVREPRMVLKNVGVDRSIKIVSEKKQPQQPKPQVKAPEPEVQEERQDDKKRQKRGNRRRGKGSQDQEVQEEQPQVLVTGEETAKVASQLPSPSALSALLAPPTTLISETLTRYRRDEAFKQAFYEKEEDSEETIIAPAIPSTEEFDEGDHIIFRGHETPTDFKPYSEEQAEEPQEDPFNLKEEYTQASFDEQDEQP